LNFLETKPEESQVAAAKEGLAKCGEADPQAAEANKIDVDAQGQTPEPTPPAPSGPPVPGVKDNEAPPGIATPPPRQRPVAAPVAETPDEGSGERAWYLDPVGLALCGGGLVALVGSAVVYGVAVGKNDEAATAPTYEDAIGQRDTAKTLGIVSVVSAGVGVALLGVGGYYFYRQRSERETRVTASATTHSAMIGITGRF
jgi:hypothetical protein